MELRRARRWHAMLEYTIYLKSVSNLASNGFCSTILPWKYMVQYRT